MNKRAYVYGLFHGPSKHLIYVGKTKDPSRRLRAHRCYLLRTNPNHYTMEILEETTTKHINESEGFWILYAIYIGCELKNRRIPFLKNEHMPPRNHDMAPLKHFGKIITKLKELRGPYMSQRELSSISNVTMSTISRAENQSPVSFTTIKKIASALKVSPDRLL